jgi:hypothetical protein
MGLNNSNRADRRSGGLTLKARKYRAALRKVVSGHLRRQAMIYWMTRPGR